MYIANLFPLYVKDKVLSREPLLRYVVLLWLKVCCLGCFVIYRFTGVANFEEIPKIFI